LKKSKSSELISLKAEPNWRCFSRIIATADSMLFYRLNNGTLSVAILANLIIFRVLIMKASERDSPMNLIRLSQ
jgi:hypothetical protein